MTKIHWTRHRKRLAAASIVGLIGILWGIMFWQFNLGLRLRNTSYDLPFLFSERDTPTGIALIYLDEESHKQLDQPLSEAWDRRIHATLVDRLREQGASTIVFDILFHDSKDEQDSVFADSISKHGKVILAGEILRAAGPGDPESLLLATPRLRRAAAGWGLTEPVIDADGVIRRIRHGIPTDAQGLKPTLSWITARLARGETKSGELSKTPVLLDYFGRSDSFPFYSYAAVLESRGIPADAFHGKIVFVGSRQQAGFSGAGKDMFSTPYSSMENTLTAGVEIHATAAANLLAGPKFKELPAHFNLILIVLSAVAMAAPACLMSAPRGVPLCLLLGLVIAFVGAFLHRNLGMVVLWSIPAIGQMPLIAGLSLGAHYFIEYSARWRLRRAFKSYMSDEQARQIDEDDVSLELGGKEVQATIMFTDLAGFTSMAEGLPPQEVSKALISYFERATEGILDNQGTIIKYVGDSVMATWGAPLKVEREADRAIDAAIQMQLASAIPISLQTPVGVIAQVLETRIGINSGLGLAGNLGSTRRFDYSVIGDTTNTAARLESLNKMLGTSILVAEAVLQKCVEPDRFLKRRMGSYILKGRKNSIVVYEILGYTQEPEAAFRQRSELYQNHYQTGLTAFETGDFETATRHLTECTEHHDRLPDDPAARLMLDAISKITLSDAGLPSPWAGEIVLESK